MKTCQLSQSQSLKDLAMMRDEAHTLRSRNEELKNQVSVQQKDLLLQKEDILREKEIMVAKLEMLDDSSDVDANEKPLHSNLMEDEMMSKLEKRLQDAQSALDKEKHTVNDLAFRKQELEKRNLELKEHLVNEQARNLQVAQDLEETRENLQQLQEEVRRTAHTNQEKNCETLSLKSNLQAFEQKNLLLQNQLTSLQNDISKSTSIQQKLKQELEAKGAEKVLAANELERLRQAAKEMANIEGDLKDLRKENIQLKIETVKVEQLRQEKESLETKVKSLKLEVDLHTEKTEEKKQLKCERDALTAELDNSLIQIDQLKLRCEKLVSIEAEFEDQVLLLKGKNIALIEELEKVRKEMKRLEDVRDEQNQLLVEVRQENAELRGNIEKIENQFNDEKVDLGRVIQQLQNVQEKLLKDKSHGVSFKEELFEKVQNSDRENKEKIKILDSSLKHCEIRLGEQTTAKEACMRDLEDLQEVEREQQNLIRLQKDKMRRMEMEIKAIKDENKRKEETLNNCRMDLLQLEKEKGQLSAVSFENKALKENCALLEKSLDKFNDCQGRVSILEQSLFKSKEILHNKEEAIVDLQKSNQELKQKARAAIQNLTKERQEVLRLKIAVDASNTLIQKTEEKLAARQEEFNQLQIDHIKLKDEKTKLEKIYQGSVDEAAELKIRLENKHHMENVLEDRMKTLNAHLQEKNQAVDLIKKEKDHKEIMHKSEINQLNNQILKIQKHLCER